MEAAGALAFLFTDLEHSTQLWETGEEAMKVALARNDELLSRAILEPDGILFKHTGDGVCAAFASPGAAVHAAVAASGRWSPNRGLARRSERAWVSITVLRSHASDYFGSTVNRCARVMEAGHGGQVLCTGAAWDSARADAASSVTVRDLGAHRLRDLTEPERLYQIARRRNRLVPYALKAER